MRLKETTIIKCCMPFCCFGAYDAEVIAHWIMMWDFFVLFVAIFYDLWTVDIIGYWPLFFMVFHAILLFMVVYDLRQPENRLQFTLCYNYYRIFVAFGFIVLGIVSIIFSYVAIANPKVEKQYNTYNWFIFYAWVAIIIGVIQGLTVIQMFKALRAIRSISAYEYNAKELNSSITSQRTAILGTRSHGAILMTSPYDI